MNKINIRDLETICRISHLCFDTPDWYPSKVISGEKPGDEINGVCETKYESCGIKKIENDKTIHRDYKIVRKKREEDM